MSDRASLHDERRLSGSSDEKKSQINENQSDKLIKHPTPVELGIYHDQQFDS